MRRAVVSTLSLALVVPVLTACGLFEGGGHLDDALDLVPADASGVEFVDRSALAERLEIEDADPGDYLEAVSDDAVGGSPLAQYLELMADGAAFDERDVEWSATGVDDEASFEMYKLDDDVDLDELGDELVDLGFTEDELRGRRRLTGDVGLAGASGLFGEAYPLDFREATFDDDEHLLVLGAGADSVLETLDDEADSMTDADTFDDVLDGTDDVEYAWLDQDPACATGGRATPEQLAATAEQLGDVGSPEASGYFVSGGDLALSARLQFGDDDEAEADLEARRTYLEDGVLLATRQPFSDVGSAELERDGSVVQIDLDLEDPEVGRRMVQESDGFFVCQP